MDYQSRGRRFGRPLGGSVTYEAETGDTSFFLEGRRKRMKDLELLPKSRN